MERVRVATLEARSANQKLEDVRREAAMEAATAARWKTAAGATLGIAIVLLAVVLRLVAAARS